MRASLLGPRDVLFAFSRSGDTRDIIDATQAAKTAGATIIGVTNNPRSFFAKLVNIKLVMKSRESRFRNDLLATRIEHLSVVDALFTALASREPARITPATGLCMTRSWANNAEFGKEFSLSLKNASPISMTVPGPADFSSAALRSSLYQKLVDSFPWYVWWLAPAVIILAVITLFPFFWMIYISFMKVQLAPGATDMFVGWSNWRQMFLDRSVYDGWQLLFEYVATCMVLQMALGLGIALLLNDIKREGLIVTVIMIPMMVAPVVVGHLFNLLLNSSYGLYAWILKSLGIYSAGSLLSNPSTALWALVAMDTWEWTPLIVLILLAGLKSVPEHDRGCSRGWLQSLAGVHERNASLPQAIPAHSLSASFHGLHALYRQ